jgi:lysophospholipase L1-like esterase
MQGDARCCPLLTPTPPVAYVAIGDSLTAGDGADNQDTQSYPALLAAHLAAGTRFLNLGVPGDTLDSAITDELPQALAAHPPLATVWIGRGWILCRIQSP